MGANINHFQFYINGPSEIFLFFFKSKLLLIDILMSTWTDLGREVPLRPSTRARNQKVINQAQQLVHLLYQRARQRCEVEDHPPFATLV